MALSQQERSLNILTTPQVRYIMEHHICHFSAEEKKLFLSIPQKSSLGADISNLAVTQRAEQSFLDLEWELANISSCEGSARLFLLIHRDNMF